jgi:hypothetical protein
MNDRDKRRYDSFKRVQKFGDDNAADFAAGSVAQTNLTIVDQVIAGLDKAKAGQVGNANTSMDTLLNAVRLDIQSITRTAAAMDQDEPGFLPTPFVRRRLTIPPRCSRRPMLSCSSWPSKPVTAPPPKPPRPR